jgi:hypothetical protein
MGVCPRVLPGIFGARLSRDCALRTAFGSVDVGELRAKIEELRGIVDPGYEQCRGDRREPYKMPSRNPGNRDRMADPAKRPDFRY